MRIMGANAKFADSRQKQNDAWYSSSAERRKRSRQRAHTEKSPLTAMSEPKSRCGCLRETAN